MEVKRAFKGSVAMARIEEHRDEQCIIRFYFKHVAIRTLA